MMAAAQSRTRKLKVAIVAPSLRYVGGQAVQADLLLRLWKNDPEVDVTFIAVDPQLPRPLSWAEEVFRVCEPFYANPFISGIFGAG